MSIGYFQLRLKIHFVQLHQDLSCKDLDTHIGQRIDYFGKSFAENYFADCLDFTNVRTITDVIYQKNQFL